MATMAITAPQSYPTAAHHWQMLDVLLIGQKTRKRICESYLLNATLRWRMADTKSPNRSVPSFLIYLNIRMDMTSVPSWKPTSSRASFNLSALRIPAFSLEWFLKAVCQYFRLHIRSLKSLNFSLPQPVLCYVKVKDHNYNERVAGLVWFSLNLPNHTDSVVIMWLGHCAQVRIPTKGKNSQRVVESLLTIEFSWFSNYIFKRIHPMSEQLGDKLPYKRSSLCNLKVV